MTEALRQGESGGAFEYSVWGKPANTTYSTRLLHGVHYRKGVRLHIRVLGWEGKTSVLLELGRMVKLERGSRGGTNDLNQDKMGLRTYSRS
jgi:hypothetical protein